MTARARLAEKWDAYLGRPFPRLVELSMHRIFHGSNAGEGELNLSMGLMLALLALPGAFVSIMLFDKYGSFLQWLRGQTKFDALSAAFPDEYFFIVLSMVVTGGVAVWWWDSIFPDRRDFANLVHLPISTARIFLANSLAILILTGLCALDVNAASSVLFPAVVGAAQPTMTFVVRFAAVHALVVVLASLFSFFAVFAAAGLLMLLLPYALFRRVSLYVRTLIAVSLLAALSTSFAVPRMIANLPRHSRSFLRFLPSAWFVGLCQLLRHRTSPVLTDLGHTSVLALIAAAVLAVAAYALSYRRCFIRLPELADTPSGQLGAHSWWIFRVLDFPVLRTPFQRAGYRFALKTIFRNEAHALALGGFAGLGLILASRTLLSAMNGRKFTALPSAELLSIPLILGYWLLVGARFVFDLPAHLRANWIFRLLIEKNARESGSLARRVMLSLVLPWTILVAFPVYLHFWGVTIALVHTALVTLWFVLLTEVLLAGFRKLPFTCAYPAFQHSSVVVVMAYVLGYFAFTALISELEAEALSSPVTGTVFFLIALGLWYAAYRGRRSFSEGDGRVVFEDTAPAPFEFLHLTDGG